MANTITVKGMGIRQEALANAEIIKWHKAYGNHISVF